MTTIPVDLAERRYDVHVGPDAIDQLGEVWAALGLGRTAAIVTDRTVERHHGARLLQILRAAGVNAQTIPVPPGESSKSWQWADRLYTRLAWAEFDRRTTIVALGGGVVGDLAGFVAATYMRGLDWIVVPTTLLAQVDAAIGGKTGINHRLGKNLVGAYHQPRAVVADPHLLHTLPERQLRNGFAEVLKYGLIADPALWGSATAALQDSSEGEALPPLVERSVEIKSGIVARDEHDLTGERALLNFGHTLGHALESTTDYQTFLHGEAVIWGMRGESWISHRHGRLSSATFRAIDARLRSLDVPAWPEDVDIDEIIAYVRRDKKADAGRIRCVLLDDLGQAELADIDEDDIRGAIAQLKRPSTTRS